VLHCWLGRAVAAEQAPRHDRSDVGAVHGAERFRVDLRHHGWPLGELPLDHRVRDALVARLVLPAQLCWRNVEHDRDARNIVRCRQRSPVRPPHRIRPEGIDDGRQLSAEPPFDHIVQHRERVD
jgi:hypothetical protein